MGSITTSNDLNNETAINSTNNTLDDFFADTGKSIATEKVKQSNIASALKTKIDMKTDSTATDKSKKTTYGASNTTSNFDSDFDNW
ncbi:hypothetical protein RFI_09373 [Reticulomyxa filosa]|uniref:Uncharacterized protein n=1 Tax=Reticulomyxa filosa TaxID=46433 RepID=X6NPA8_RETFI|nr:hypothetical protein RFI_09373 [Reticulomyxa filosa]|eukprot:ETO27758.1 hypothetical protein RFI_09373 [Reticulomyxa filosa]